MKKKGYKNEGFTLVEILIYIAIIGAVVTSFILFTFNISTSRNKTYVVQEVQANARMALGVISQKIRMAESVDIEGSIFDIDPGYLKLIMATTTLNPTVITLNQDDGLLVIKAGENATTSVVSDEVKVTNLIFADLTATSTRENIKVDITVEFNNEGTDIIYDYLQSLQTAVGVRQ